jgi:predicted permease
MIRNYFLTAWRNLRKNKLNAVINITGLAVAFTCCILLFLMVRYEFSYDQFHASKNRLFEVYNLDHPPAGDNKSEAMSYPMGPALKAEVPSVAKATAFMSAGSGIRYKGKDLYPRTTLVDNDFFSMFSFPIVAGNATSPLADLGNVVINQTTATALFGQEDPIGKPVQLKLGAQWKELTVSAVIRDAPGNSTLRYSVLARIEINAGYPEEKENWNAQHHPVFVQLAPGATQKRAEAEIRQMMKKHIPVDDENQMKSQGYRKDSNGDYYANLLAPFTTLHFDEELSPRDAVNKVYLYTLVLISVVVMVIACFNFINLNVARSFTRAKEVGIRKTIGADKRQIYFQMWAESLLLFLLAVLASLGLSALALQPFNDLFVEKLKLQMLLQPSVILVVLAMTVLVSFLAGGYPAWLVARFNAVEVLKGKVSVRRSSLLRSGLITFQFVMASGLICSTIVIYQQFQHLRSAPLGFDQESVISLPVKKPENTARYVNELRLQLASNPQVENVTASSVNIGIGEDKSQSHQGIGFSYKDKGIMTTIVRVDYDFLKVLGMKVTAGRDFSHEFTSDTSSNVTRIIVTESLAQQFGAKDPVGLSFYPDSAKPKWTIIGVIPDFHLYSMHEHMEPTTLMIDPHAALNYIMVKIKTSNPAVAMSQVQSAFKKLEPDNSTNASFLSENTQRWYEKERRLADIFFSAAFIAILLSCLGLFAIVSLIMEQRRKEIGVRKVLGATISSITGLLSRDFVRLVLLAFVIAAPIAWYLLHRWLDNFLYRTSIGWWVFPLAGVATLFIALLTVSVQTMRAALANPVKSLRSE